MNEPISIGNHRKSPAYLSVRCPTCGRVSRTPRPKEASARATFAVLCELMGTSPEEMVANDRRCHTALVRQIITATMREVEPGISFPMMGRILHRHHATMLYSCRQVRSQLVHELAARFRQVRERQ